MTRNGARAGAQEVGPRTAQAYDHHHVVLRGPGGRDCAGRWRFSLGYLTGRARTVTRTVTIGHPGRRMPPRARPEWCPGEYAGHVEHRQPDRSPGIPVERLGELSSTVSRPLP